MTALEASAACADGSLLMYPLSYQQQGLWLLHALDPSSIAYTLGVPIRLFTPVAVPALRAALEQIVRRHPQLRARYCIVGGAPMHRVTTEVGEVLEFCEHDARGWARGDLERRVQEAFNRPFDLERGPVLRADYFQREGDEFEAVLLIRAHHISMDAWSFEMLLGELGVVYDALRAGREPDLPPLAVEYRDYVRRQREMIAGPEGADLAERWRQRLGAQMTPPELPRQGAHGPVESHSTSFTLPGDLSRALHELAQREGSTLYPVLLAAFQVLLHRYTQQDSFVIGTAIGGRSGLGVDAVFGHFVNLVPMPLRVEEGDTAQSLIAKARSLTRQARDDQHYPFELLAKHLKTEGSAGAALTVLFEYRRSRTPDDFLWSTVTEEGPERFRIGSLVGGAFPLRQQEGKFDLQLEVANREGHIQCIWKYRTPALSHAFVARMTEHYQRVLQQITAAPDRPAAQIDILGDEERRWLLDRGRARAAGAPRLLHRIIEEQARLYPTRRAVVDGVESLTYADLDARADALAGRLRALGVTQGALVGLSLERSPQLIVAILGILKAGGAYVPIDPMLPPARMAFILDDARPRAVVTQRSLVDRIPSGGAATLVVDDGAAPAGAEAGAADEDPGALAYVIYTSGSTGSPKGVRVTHANVSELLQATEREFAFGPEDVWTQFHSYGFDFSVWEIFGALCYGGTLVIVPREVALDPALFHRLLCSEGVTVLNQTPSAFRQFDAIDASGVTEGSPALRLIIFGGEALLPDTLRGWVRRHGDEAPRLVNMYGITETCVHVTSRRITRADTERGEVSPIGGPLPHLCVYVLDAEGRLLPRGVPGELYVGGSGVSLGYLNRPELTAQRFIEDPFGGAPGARLYRSGDLARYAESGDLEYLGRGDDQIKIRGYRIELGEVEQAVRSHPLVQNATVRACKLHGADVQLVAYVVLAESSEAGVLAGEDIRRHVALTLPPYMVPSHVVAVPAIPLNANGKVDARALPDPTRPTGGAAEERWATETERRVAAIWREVLRLDTVTRSDDFFAVGGHSLTATSVVVQVRAAFGVQLPIVALFHKPRLADFAEDVENAERVGIESRIPRLPAGEQPPLSLAQRRLWFLHCARPDVPVYNLPVLLRVRGQLDRAALSRALDAVQARHAVLRTTYTSDDGIPRAVVAAAATFRLPCVTVAHLPDAEREAEALRLAQREVDEPFALDRGPIWRAALIEVTPDDHLLVIVVHHVAFDGRSTDILLSEVAAAYDAFHAGRAPELPELPFAYGDFAAWQERAPEAQGHARARAYWKAKLADLPADLELPHARPRPPVQRFRGAGVPVALGADLTEKVARFSREHKVTPFAVLLAAFKILIHRYTGARDVVVGAPIQGRLRADVDQLIGCFVNTLVLRTALDPASGFAQAAEGVQQTVAEALDHQELPFEAVVEELAPPRSPDRNPLFQMAFAFQSKPAQAARLGDASVESLLPESTTAKFDLLFGLAEDEHGVRGYLEYSTDLFDRPFVERLRGHFVTLLDGGIASPGAPIAALPMLTEAERRLVVEEWNATRADLGAPRAVHLLVEEQARRRPAAPAVALRDDVLTYGELDAHADRLARGIQAAGARPGAVVGVLLDRSFDLVAGLLAIWKSGCVYLPLDTSYPTRRLSYIIEDAAPAVVLTTRAHADRVPPGCRALRLDDGSASLDRLPAAERPIAVEPSAPAYLIYTSGSTGRPKGVVCRHDGLYNRLVWMRRAYGIGPEERILHKTSIGFDVSLWELLEPLISGAVLHLAEPRRQADPSYLVREIARGITIAHFVPSMLREFLAADGLEACTRLRRVFCSGEALTSDVQQLFFEKLGAELHNLYGPTEASIEVTSWACERRSQRRSVPIGKPIANTRVYVVDAAMEPMPAGVPGELCIGGVQVAVGYHQRPDLTEERFVPDPFGGPLDRLYRTGDRVYWAEDGNVEYLGRIDEQVKVRGHRVELGEVECVLREHPSVRGAAVVAWPDPDGGVRLVAYLAGDRAALSDTRALRAHLSGKLPDAMIPSTFVPVDDLPLTASGKLDRRALPPPPTRPAPAEDAVPEADDGSVERDLLRIWRDLLGVEAVKLDDNFFDLGGHSLHLIRLKERIQSRWRVTLDLLDLFSYSTVRGQARLIGGGASPAEAAPIRGQGRAQRLERMRSQRDGESPKGRVE